MPLPATLFTPEFVTLQRVELKVLFNDLRSALYAQVYMLLVLHSNFKTGEVLTNYARLVELCSPPSREKGGRGKGPTERQIRYAIEQLILYGLVKRNAGANEAQGTLRLYVRKRKETLAKPRA